MMPHHINPRNNFDVREGHLQIHNPHQFHHFHLTHCWNGFWMVYLTYLQRPSNLQVWLRIASTNPRVRSPKRTSKLDTPVYEFYDCHFAGTCIELTVHQDLPSVCDPQTEIPGIQTQRHQFGSPNWSSPGSSFGPNRASDLPRRERPWLLSRSWPGWTWGCTSRSGGACGVGDAYVSLCFSWHRENRPVFLPNINRDHWL